MKISQLDLQRLKSAVGQVLAGKSEEWKNRDLHLPVEPAVATVLLFEGVAKDDTIEDANEGFMTNGWQYDWWQHFTFEGRKFVLCGHGYYGGLSFHSNGD